MNVLTQMNMRTLLTFLLCMTITCGWSASIKGKVTDHHQEALVGAHVVIQQQNLYALAGLDGSFVINNLAPGQYSLVVSFVGYRSFIKEVTITSSQQTVSLNCALEPDQLQLAEVTVSAKAEGGSDAYARTVERTSPNTLNIISAKAIALSPDISVANVVQRVSGLSVERSSNGDPQYAIVRGMDKRYSYTLVNGVKIPSPDNKNRYVPLDIFPAALLERLEVYKSLTADLEGDAIGGGINMVMKSAPEQLEVKGDLQVGYNYINSVYGFDKYNTRVVSQQSPREKYGTAFQAQPDDFTKKNLEVVNGKPLPDMLGSISIGNRYAQDRLGIMIGGSFQNAYRGTKSLWFDFDTDRYGKNLPSLRSYQDRYYSTRQMRTALHARVDYRINKRHELQLYSGYYTLNNYEARQIKETYLDGRNYSVEGGNAILSYSTRTRTTLQGIQTTALQGTHHIAQPVSLSWSGVYSIASNKQPDNARFVRNGELRNFEEQPQNVERRNSRQWLRNEDHDITGFVNVKIQPSQWASSFVKAGSMYRMKTRDSYYNRYVFDPNPGLQIQGQHWEKYSDVRWEVINPSGSATDELNYQADENVFAYYALGKASLSNVEVNAGVRIENTLQGYTLTFPKGGQTPDSTQRYQDVLPSLSIKYSLKQNTNLRFTYFKGISRPGFFEIVPYQLEDDGYKDIGNPGLRRVRSDNVDLRWERFTNAFDQLLIGVFYKRIVDPIEYAVVRSGINNEPVMQPNNFNTARNMGVELDVTRFYNKIGFKFNYTYTHSVINTSKILRTRVDENDVTSELTIKNVDQRRPLQGQARHIGNLSLLYKNIPKGWDAQLSLVYTGERLEALSPFLDNDIYSKPILIVDLSIEKRLSRSFDLFFKATNLLNASYEMYIRKPVFQEEGKFIAYPYQQQSSGKTLVRRDDYFQSFRAGLRYQWNKNK